jgi:hypothetical protein
MTDVPGWIAPALRDAIAWGERVFDRERDPLASANRALRGSVLALEDRMVPLIGDDAVWELRRQVDRVLELCDEQLNSLSDATATHAMDRVRAIAVDLELA